MSLEYIFQAKVKYTDILIKESKVVIPNELKFQLRQAVFEECQQKYDHRELVIDCMDSNIKSLGKEIKNMQLKVIAYRNFIAANKEIISKEEQKQLSQQLQDQFEKVVNLKK